MGRVLSGRYVGFWASKHGEYLALGNSEKIDNVHIVTHVTKHECKKYEFLDEKYDGPNMAGAVTGALIAGTAGAIIGSAGGTKSFHVRVTWNNDEESLISLTYEEYQALIAGMNMYQTKEDWHKQEAKQAESDANFDLAFKIIGFVIVAGYFLAYVFSDYLG